MIGRENRPWQNSEGKKETINGPLRVEHSLNRVSCFEISVFKALVTLHNDMPFQTTHNDGEVCEERQRVKVEQI